MRKFGFGKVVGITALFCFATSIASPAQTFTRLAKLSGADGDGPYYGPLIQGIDGNFYGTTLLGGANKAGVVFKIKPTGTLTTLYSFCSQSGCADGSLPYAGVVQGPNGDFYGTTFEGGGANDYGTAYELTPSGQLTTLHTFCSEPECADGLAPIAGLNLATNGKLYGTTSQSVAGAVGTIFELTTTGGFTTIFSTKRAGPNLGVLQTVEGSFYGVNESGGGIYGAGSVFEISADTYSTVFSFDMSDGQWPNLPILAADGNFYGTTQSGGANDSGAIFKLTPTGEFTLLYSFCSLANCADGGIPHAGLVQGTDGNFYGTTTFGGAVEVNGVFEGYGTIFQITPTGTLTTIHTFCLQGGNCADGAYPFAGLVQGTDGRFYGTTFGTSECPGNCGTIFSLSMGLSPFVKANPNFGRVGAVVTILGSNLTNTSSVTFNGISAKFEVGANTYIRAEVPTGATAGTIEVTTPSGTLSSNVQFQILP